MNHEANAIFLRRMKEEIVTQRLALGFSPVKKESFAYTQLMTKADAWKRQIEVMQRELKSKSHHNAMVLESQGRGGGYSARQSFDGKEKNVAELYLMTLGIATELAELLKDADGGVGPTRTALDALGNSFKKLAELASNPDQAELWVLAVQRGRSRHRFVNSNKGQIHRNLLFRPPVSTIC